MIKLLASRCQVFVLVRRREAMAGMRALGARPVPGDLDDQHSLARLAGLADAVLHFAPPAREQGLGLLRDMRTRRLLAALGRSSLPQRIIYLSTTGVYGYCAGALIDETHPPQPDNARAERRLDAERCLRAFGRRAGVGVVVLRVPGIYAHDRLPEDRLLRGDPVPVEPVYTSHIHADDLARLVVTALFHARPGRIYNAVDYSRLIVGDYYDLVADALGLARPPRLPWGALEEALSATALSFLSGSKQIKNARVRYELKFIFAWPTVADALDQLPSA